MSQQDIECEEYSAVADALRAMAGRAAATRDGTLSIEAQRAPRLLLVAFIDTWSPPAQAMAVALNVLRRDVKAFAQIVLVNALSDRDAAWEAGVVTTPALMFYWDGELARVRRPTWEDDNKITGVVSAERLAEIVRHARDCCSSRSESGQLVISLDF
jgi:hypothetical protein